MHHEDALKHQLARLDLSRPEDRERYARGAMYAVVWPSATVLLALLQELELAGRTVLELGCGPGVPSLYAAEQGARVLATDHHPDCPALVLQQATERGLQLEAHAADWADASWDPGAFDLVIASDVLFAYDCPEGLAGCIRRTLAPDGLAIVVDPGRPWHTEFERAAVAQGLTIHTTLEEVGDVVALVTRLRRTAGVTPPGDPSHLLRTARPRSA